MDVAYDLSVDLGIDTTSDLAIALEVVDKLNPGLEDRLLAAIKSLQPDDLQSLSLSISRGPDVPNGGTDLDAELRKETVSIRVTIDPTLSDDAAIIEYCFEEISFAFLQEAVKYRHAGLEITRFELGTAYAERGRLDDAEAAWLQSIRTLADSDRLNTAATESLVSQSVSRLEGAGHVDEANALRSMLVKVSR